MFSKCFSQHEKKKPRVYFLQNTKAWTFLLKTLQVGAVCELVLHYIYFDDISLEMYMNEVCGNCQVFKRKAHSNKDITETFSVIEKCWKIPTLSFVIRCQTFYSYGKECEDIDQWWLLSKVECIDPYWAPSKSLSSLLYPSFFKQTFYSKIPLLVWNILKALHISSSNNGLFETI